MDEKKVNEWHFKESLSEDNIPKLFWRAILSLKENGELNIPPALKEHISLTPHILISAVEKGTYPSLLEVSKTSVIYYGLLFYWKVDCVSCFAEVLKSLSSEPGLVAALRMLINKEGSIPFLKSVLAKAPLEFLQAAVLLPIDDLRPFIDEIYRIAKEEIGDKQYKALSLLADFIDDEKVKQLFMMFSDDWDPKVRRISIRALKAVSSDPQVVSLAKRLVRDEEDAINKAILKQIIDKAESEGRSEL